MEFFQLTSPDEPTHIDALILTFFFEFPPARTFSSSIEYVNVCLLNFTVCDFLLLPCQLKFHSTDLQIPEAWCQNYTDVGRIVTTCPTKISPYDRISLSGNFSFPIWISDSGNFQGISHSGNFSFPIWIYHSGDFSFPIGIYHSGNLSFRDFIIQGIYHSGNLVHSWNLSFMEFIIHGIYHSWNLSFMEFIIQGIYHSGNLSFREFIIQGIYHSGNLSFREFIIQGIYHSWNLIPPTGVYYPVEVPVVSDNQVLGLKNFIRPMWFSYPVLTWGSCPNNFLSPKLFFVPNDFIQPKNSSQWFHATNDFLFLKF